MEESVFANVINAVYYSFDKKFRRTVLGCFNRVRSERYLTRPCSTRSHRVVSKRIQSQISTIRKQFENNNLSA